MPTPPCPTAVPSRRPGSLSLLLIASIAGPLALFAAELRAESTPEPRAARPESARPRGIDPDEAHCLALSMYFEARAEGREGMRAVGHVVLNRMADPRFPATPCAVVRDGGEQRGCQFSWYCDGRSDVPTHRKAWRRAGALAYALLAGRLEDTTDGALFYHATYIDEPWRVDRTRTRVIGQHVFYR